MPSLSFQALHGYLEGAIDLVCEAAGRYWIMDWKSNYLGGTAVHYAPAALADAMDRHGYHLQYLLYTVALHRYLRSRIRNYTFEAHIGGVLYLFVRGVRPEWTQDGQMPAGVFAHTPPALLIEELSALLDGPRGGE